ncbi:MAG TPA: hypothetical protein DD376_05645 [Sutterella sp.]|nr:hypothetical protein [Sutterella sp.]
MRRDLVVQVVLDYGDFVETFATPYEAESYLNANIDELDIPIRAWLEDLRGNVKWTYDIFDDDSGLFRLFERPFSGQQRLIRNNSN